MASNPFSSDYVGAPATQAVIALPASAPTAEAMAILEQTDVVDISSGFKITPIPMVSGKPKRVIIKGKVTRD